MKLQNITKINQIDPMKLQIVRLLFERAELKMFLLDCIIFSQNKCALALCEALPWSEARAASRAVHFKINKRIIGINFH
jgi:hypothetical protein